MCIHCTHNILCIYCSKVPLTGFRFLFGCSRDIPKIWVGQQFEKQLRRTASHCTPLVFVFFYLTLTLALNFSTLQRFHVPSMRTDAAISYQFLCATSSGFILHSIWQKSECFMSLKWVGWLLTFLRLELLLNARSVETLSCFANIAFVQYAVGLRSRISSLHITNPDVGATPLLYSVMACVFTRLYWLVQLELSGEMTSVY